VTPEQRAEQVYGHGQIIWRDRASHVADIAHAIRAAENAALERAARDCLRCTVGFFPTEADLRPTFAKIARALKTRAPRARRGK